MKENYRYGVTNSWDLLLQIISNRPQLVFRRCFKKHIEQVHMTRAEDHQYPVIGFGFNALNVPENSKVPVEPPPCCERRGSCSTRVPCQRIHPPSIHT